MTAAALALEHIRLTYRGRTKPALDDVSLHVGVGECVGVVGESGSGKSSLAAVALGLETAQSGDVFLHGKKLSPHVRRRTPAQLNALQIVFQDPAASLDPTWPVWRSVTEGLALRGAARPAGLRATAEALLAEMAMSGAFLDRKPHELSGGQRQRVALARALAVKPDVLVLDEPTSALDVSVQAQVLDLLLDVQERRGLSLVMISHDLDVVRHLCTRIAVMRDGRVVEAGSADEIFSDPKQDYTRALVGAAARLSIRR
ncbi:MAG: ATP-binding cassette domain-containing protein [Hyphomonadaceae bacterium]|nr:ATP-binding cassette domain-containing protein [Hyphomonadaceae bacterium]